jgi:2-desacetyl-2-hydroxyethyl bacteriochlorophyllide A dehydrogenase
MRALRITADFSLPEALVHFMNLLRPHPSESGSIAVLPGSKLLSPDDFEFNEISYLEAKNEIDVKSYNSAVQATLLSHLERRIQHRFDKRENSKRTPLVAVDLGAGLLNMLPTVQKIFSDAAAASALGDLELQYIAFESNKKIQKRTIEMLANSGFASIPSSIDLTAATASTIRSDVQSFKGTMTAQGDTAFPMTVTVHLISEDFMTDAAGKILKDLLESHRCEGNFGTAASSSMYTRARPSVDLFIGCCVADLIPPTELVSQVVEMAGDNGGLLYLPITFCGETKLVRGKPTKSQDSKPSPDSSKDALPVPSDSEVFDVYHRHLESRGHYIGTDRLISTLGAYGCTVVTPGDRSAGSDWKISRANNPYMWKCMMRFVALGTAFETLGKFDLKTWFDGLTFDRSEKGKGVGEGEGEEEEPDIEIAVRNIDIVAVLPEIVQRILSPTEMSDKTASAGSTYCTDFSSPPADALKVTPKISRLSQPLPLHAAFHTKKQELAPPSIRRSVEFLSPGNVHIVEEEVPKVGANQLLIRTSCSLISTGTELKVFKGDLDPDEPADLTIDSLKEKMAYPLRYGYSLAGEVVAVGEGVDEADWLGKLVFSFSPHSSAVVIDVSSAMLVPEGIAPEDAVFLPSVETAVSFVQAARPNIGEKVLIVGQGLIGMLTGAVMSQLSNADTTIADVSEKRLAAASSFNSKATTWNPTSPRTRDPAFDLSVEVSGHPGGLQTAIDNTGSNGRIVIGSWYGEKPTQVKLGLKFHRSGIQLVTSQVSNIPPELTGRWDKKRRFDLTWNTIRLIKPSRLISSVSALRSEDVLAAYIRLEKGEDVTVLFRDDL